jgi:hypothetical protein
MVGVLLRQVASITAIKRAATRIYKARALGYHGALNLVGRFCDLVVDFVKDRSMSISLIVTSDGLQ